MSPILFDTSVWIDFLNGIRSKNTDLLDQYIKEDLPVMLCPTIIQEILQGIKSDQQHSEVKQSLLSFTVLNLDPVRAAVLAADLYRLLRKKGLTIRRSNDCLIAVYAIHFDVKVCHTDRDFDSIAKFSPMQIIK